MGQPVGTEPVHVVRVVRIGVGQALRRLEEDAVVRGAPEDGRHVRVGTGRVVAHMNELAGRRAAVHVELVIGVAGHEAIPRGEDEAPAVAGERAGNRRLLAVARQVLEVGRFVGVGSGGVVAHEHEGSGRRPL